MGLIIQDQTQRLIYTWVILELQWHFGPFHEKHFEMTNSYKS